MAFIIKKLEPSDWQEWRDIRLEALTLHPEAFGSDIETETMRSESEWRSTLSDSTIFAGLMNNKIVGVIGFFISTPVKMRHRGTLFGMYINKDFRKSGLSHALMEHVINFARGKVLQIHCTVITSNPGAKHLYERHGFTIYGIEPRALKMGNAFFDEYLMVKMVG
jgi:ribosomal protein S18 acetylase RimI-like enzyme